MSIKTKLTMIISGSLLLILLINIMISFYSDQANLRENAETQMMMVAEEIAISVNQSQASARFVEQQLEEYLRLGSIMVSKELDADINNITNEQLAKLSEDIRVSHISLMIRSGKDVVVAKSSDPKEVGQSSVGLGYKQQALFQLFDQLQVTIPEGNKLDHFWSGPFEYFTFNPENTNKNGYYYDGKRNYIINPYMYNTLIKDYAKFLTLEDTLDKTLNGNSQILEVTGIDPILFGNSRLLTNIYDREQVKLSIRSIRFGTYNYSDLARDKQAISEVMKSGKQVVFEGKIGGTRVLKSFIPIITEGESTYIISVVTDMGVISSAVKEHLIHEILLSLVLFVIVIIGSYILAGFIVKPIQRILKKVNDVGNGLFDTYLAVNTRDELGLLSTQISMMAFNMNYNTNQLKQTLDENRSVKEHFESVINQTADAIYTVDIYRNVIQVNEAFEQLYGWKYEEVVGKPLNLVPSHLELEDLERLAQILRGIQLPLTETIHVRKDGSIVEVSVNTSPIRDKDGHIISLISVSRDMTERNRMEEYLRRSEKLTTVGQLAAGVAHEIRNPLTTLRGFMQLQKENEKYNERHIDIMLSELDRINLIVSEFLILAKPQAVLYQEEDIRIILEDVVSLLDSQAHLCDTEFKCDFPEEEIKIHCEENQLKQVFINVFKNAMEAMPQGGVITICLSFPDANHVMISVQDEGVGISEEMLPKLGEPFFSNKMSGTGLGLMVTQRIVHGHKGTFEVESRVDEGTLIKIIFPLALTQQETD